MENSLVSVIMSVYNENEEWIHESINSILRQTYKKLEFIIILDNPRNTKADDIIKSYLKRDNRIKYYINEKNIGLTKSLNFALKQCNGNFIARMDADDVSTYNRIEKQLTYLVNNNLDLVGSNIEYFFENKSFDKSNFPQKNHDIKLALMNGNCMAHPTWFVKKEVYERLHGYRQIPYCEDFDFLLRTIKKKFKIGNIDDRLLYYRLSPNSISRTYLLEQRLITDYLIKNYDDLEKVTVHQIELYIKKLKITNSKKNKYIKAYQYALKANECKNKGRKVLYYLNLLLSSLISYNFFRLNYLNQVIIKLKNNK